MISTDATSRQLFYITETWNSTLKLRFHWTCTRCNLPVNGETTVPREALMDVFLPSAAVRCCHLLGFLSNCYWQSIFQHLSLSLSLSHTHTHTHTHTHELVNTQQCLPFMAAPSTVALSHRKPASAEIPRDTCSGQYNEQRRAPYFASFCLEE